MKARKLSVSIDGKEIAQFDTQEPSVDVAVDGDFDTECSVDAEIEVAGRSYRVLIPFGEYLRMRENGFIAPQ